MNNFGTELKLVLMSESLSQKLLAEEIGATQQAISRLVKHGDEPSDKLFEKICNTRLWHNPTSVERLCLARLQTIVDLSGINAQAVLE